MNKSMVASLTTSTSSASHQNSTLSTENQLSPKLPNSFSIASLITCAQQQQLNSESLLNMFSSSNASSSSSSNIKDELLQNASTSEPHGYNWYSQQDLQNYSVEPVKTSESKSKIIFYL